MKKAEENGFVFRKIRKIHLFIFRNASSLNVMEDDGKLIETIHTRGVAMAHGLAIDWVGKNMYWTDKGM